MKNHLSRTHAIVFVSLFAAFTLFVFLITNAALDEGPGHDHHVMLSTLGTLTGPLVGAISRSSQGCCLRFSLAVMAYCAPFPLIGLLAQFIGLPEHRWSRVVRMLLWVIGWLTWFMGGLVSLGHAVE